MQECERSSFSDRLGRWGVMRVVWCAIPWFFRPFVFPYCLLVYSRFLADSTDVGDVKSLHIAYCYESKAFRLFRPRFHLIKKALLSLNVSPVDQIEQEAITMVLPIPEGSDEQRSTPLSTIPREVARPVKQG
jgi:hypothetical protein